MNKQKQQQQLQLEVENQPPEMIGLEELQLLKESRRLDLEEDSTSRLMGSTSLTDDGHADEYSLSAVGGEELMMDGVEEEAEEGEDGDLGEMLMSGKQKAIQSVTSSSSVGQQMVSGNCT